MAGIIRNLLAVHIFKNLTLTTFQELAKYITDFNGKINPTNQYLEYFSFETIDSYYFLILEMMLLKSIFITKI